VRRSNGYDDTGKKKYIRYFQIVKYTPTQNAEPSVVSS